MGEGEERGSLPLSRSNKRAASPCTWDISCWLTHEGHGVSREYGLDGALRHDFGEGGKRCHTQEMVKERAGFWCCWFRLLCAPIAFSLSLGVCWLVEKLCGRDGWKKEQEGVLYRCAAGMQPCRAALCAFRKGYDRYILWCFHV